MIWTKDTSLDVMTYNPHHIDAIVTKLGSGFKWRVTGFYGHSDMHHKHESWKLLTSLHHQYQLPWLCLGDFKEIVSMREKQGGAQRSQNQMDGFRNVINLCNFMDMGYNGSDFTWCNMREGADRIYMCLDRALATDDWRSHFQNTRVHHLIDSISDHCALLISNKVVVQPQQRRRFHFEAMWTHKEECKEVIRDAWNACLDTSTPEGLALSLRKCAVNLSS